ncbi:MAG: hypothetical protein ABR514_03735 [Chthoniobacterales bacterium]
MRHRCAKRKRAQIELYCDRPQQQWPRTPDGKIDMSTRALDLDALLNAR